MQEPGRPCGYTVYDGRIEVMTSGRESLDYKVHAMKSGVDELGHEGWRPTSS